MKRRVQWGRFTKSKKEQQISEIANLLLLFRKLTGAREFGPLSTGTPFVVALGNIDCEESSRRVVLEELTRGYP